MMKATKNTLTLSLIISSIVLLLVLQAFWLRSVYNDEHQRLNKDLHALFREVVFSMSDSLFKKNINAFPAEESFARIEWRDSLKITSSGIIKKGLKLSDTQKRANIQVFVSGQNRKDSLDDFLKPLAEKIKGSKGNRAFYINLTDEMLSEKDVRKKFLDTLKKSNLPIEFSITSVAPAINFRKRMPLHDEQFVLTPAGGFKSDFSGLNGFILKRMTPQILFSIFLTSLTAISFLMLYRNIRAQQRLAELKNDFISNMTHELKTPVTTVGVALEALKNFKGLENPALTHEYLTIAQNELSRLSLLTDKILKTSVFENRGVDFDPEAVDLEKIVEQTVQSLKLVFEKSKATVEIKKGGNDFTLRGGLIHLTNVVYNLLDNALKYSTENPTITIYLKEEAHQITLSIQDKGVGIAPEFKKKIFEKFFRVPTGDVHTVKGYGLGLSYVYAVVKAHKGTIDVDSEPGKGSNFVINLPK
ncbi:MAG: HAMP domain-containing histidine kinase [Chryseotalea sp. WA131a]|nr:MAG: HAMP domain-containing histidine kinase [Chryseotalea sp. WA131a]